MAVPMGLYLILPAVILFLPILQGIRHSAAITSHHMLPPPCCSVSPQNQSQIVKDHRPRSKQLNTILRDTRNTPGISHFTYFALVLCPFGILVNKEMTNNAQSLFPAFYLHSTGFRRGTYMSIFLKKK